MPQAVAQASHASSSAKLSLPGQKNNACRRLGWMKSSSDLDGSDQYWLYRRWLLHVDAASARQSSPVLPASSTSPDTSINSFASLRSSKALMTSALNTTHDWYSGSHSPKLET